MYPRLSVNKSIEIRDQISAAMSSGVSIVNILKMDFKNLMSQVEEGDSTLETKIEHFTRWRRSLEIPRLCVLKHPKDFKKNPVLRS